MNFTPNQKKAIHLSGAGAVNAGAGSGKTTVMIERIMHLLAIDPSLTLDQIVVITFTRKAAAELRIRLLERLRSDPSIADERRSLLLRQLDSAAISTFDSFFNRLIRPAADRFGIAPDYHVSDFSIFRDKVIQYIQIELTTRESEGDEHLRIINNHMNLREMRQVLIWMIAERIDIRFPERDPNVLLIEQRQHYLTFLERIANQIDADSIESSLNRVTESMDIHIPVFSEPLRHLYERLWQLSDKTVRETIKNAIPANIEKDLEVLVDATIVIGEQSSPWRDSDDYLINLWAAILTIGDAVRNRLNHEKYRSQSFEHADIEQFVERLLTDEDARNRLRTQYKHVMIDEFQDTNPRQFKFIEPLVRNPDTGLFDRLFVVGDPKQSIYRFRQADVTVFLETIRQLTGSSRPSSSDTNYVLMANNFRTAGPILDPINRFFEHRFSYQSGPFDVPYDALKAKAKHEGNSPTIAVFSKEAGPMAEFDWIAAEIASALLDGRAPQNIAILLSKRIDPDRYLTALNAYGIPVQDLTRTDIRDNPLTIDLYQLVMMLSQPSEVVAYALLQSPFFGYSPARAESTIQADPALQDLMRTYRDWASHTPMERFIHHAIFETPYADRSGVDSESLHFDCRRLLETLRQVDIHQIHALPELFTYPSQPGKHDPTPADAVTILTIHAAKGLEFPTVFIPNLNSRSGGANSNIIADGNGFFSSSFFQKEDRGFIADQLIQRDREADIAESKRLLYVAMTRAKSQLFLTFQQKRKSLEKDSPAEWLNQYLDNALVEARTHADFNILFDPQANPAPGTIHSTKQTSLSQFSGTSERLRTPFSISRLESFKSDQSAYFRRYHIGDFRETHRNRLTSESEAERFERQGADTGSAIHRILEDMIRLGDLTASAIISYECAQRNWADSQRDVFERHIDHARTELIALPGDLRGILAELSIRVRMQNGDLIGIFDLSAPMATQPYVIDYKSNRVTSKNLDELVNHYSNQADFYRVLMRFIRPDQPTHTYLLFTDTGQKRSVDDQHPEFGWLLRDIERQVNDIRQFEVNQLTGNLTL